jgi:hypothetical protein
VDRRADLLNQRAAFKLVLPAPPLLEEKLTKQLQLEDNTAIQLGKAIALTTLHDLANLPHFTVSFIMVDR